MSRGSFTATVVLASLLVAASPSPAAQKWLRLSTPNFELYTDGSEASGRNILLYFEQVRAFSLPAMRALGLPEKPVRIVDFRSPGEYALYCPSSLWQCNLDRPCDYIDTSSSPPSFPAINTPGGSKCQTQSSYPAFSLSGPARDFIVMTHELKRAGPSGWSEHLGVSLEASGVKLPAWINNGLLGLANRTEPVSGGLGVEVPYPWRLPRVTGMEELLRTWPAADPMVQMLTLSESYREKFPAFLKAVRDGEDDVRALSRTYGRPLSELERDLRAYALNPAQAAGIRIDVPGTFAPETQPVSPVEIGLVWAELKTTRPAHGR
jgi:hypothetical protein